MENDGVQVQLLKEKNLTNGFLKLQNFQKNF